MHISIIDDEKILTSKISKKLQLNGYGVSEFYSYSEFLKKGREFLSDLYIVDISLGDGSGFDIIKQLKQNKSSNSRIIIISGFGDPDKKIFGLDLGADDYMTKPFLPEELLARIRAIFRRNNSVSKKKAEIVKYKNIIYNKETKEIIMGGNEILLSKKEFLMFDCFITNMGKLIDKNNLVNYVWGTQSIDVNDNTINVTISRLRKRFNDNFNILSRKNFGFYLED